MPDTDTYTLEARYLDLCKKHRVLPNPVVMSWLHKAIEQKNKNKKCTMVVFLNKLYDDDISPLTDMFLDSKIDSINIFLKSFCVLSHENILKLLCAASCSKLQNVDLQDMNLPKDIIREIFKGGVDCHSLKLRFNDVQILNFEAGAGGRFKSLSTLNLDFCSSLTTIEKVFFFDGMPNLKCLSMCGTNVANLWTTSGALSRLKSLVQLRFQNRVCCKNTGPCPLFRDVPLQIEARGQIFFTGKTLEKVKTSRLQALLMNDLHGFSSIGLNSSGSKEEDTEMEDYHAKFHSQEQSESPTSVLNLDQIEWVAPEKYVLKCPSPICYEKHYREYMITTLPSLQVLDNLHITNTERKTAKIIVSMSFELLPYKRRINESITSIMRSRETASNRTKQSTLSQVYYSRSILAAKLGSSTGSPGLLPMCRDMTNGATKRVRPRQFEYHPSDSSLMAFGTLDGETVIMNHEKGQMLKCIPSLRENDRALALCWLNKHPSKLLAGFDNGALRLYDINQVPSKLENINWASKVQHYDDFKTLTSVHVNATDEKFLASSYSRNVAIFDVSCGTRLQLFSDIHREPINVAKFAQCSPHLFVTSSFDRDVKMWDLRQRPVIPCYCATSSKGNVMVCFSPNDLYLLVSAVDNEVKQLLAVDGRLHTSFDIVPTASLQNYTRSYYMNGRDYVISGSSEESVVRVCCGQTGKRLRDIHLKDGNGSSYLVHSLRSDPFCHFNMAVLAGSHRPGSPWDIVKVNMLSSDHSQGFSDD